jgi:hypothetical protein
MGRKVELDGTNIARGNERKIKSLRQRTQLEVIDI